MTATDKNAENTENAGNASSAGNATIALLDGTTIPQLGFGTWQLPGEVAYEATLAAIKTGYRHIDTAAIYGNEQEVGQAIAQAIAEGIVAREDLFVTTKLWNSDQEKAQEAMELSLEKLGLERVDLYLLHWPCPGYGKYVQAWESMIQLREAGKTTSIGVCNFYPEALDELIAVGETPVVNQIEVHPGFAQDTLRAENQARGIHTQAWSPLGQGKVLDNADIASIAEAHGKTAAQVIIRWHIQRGDIVLPRSSNAGRIAENFAVADFVLDDAQMAAITALGGVVSRNGAGAAGATDDSAIAGRIGPDPKDFNRGTPVE
ncbi:aldo/keto reductase [Corynebacterium sp. sy017]|uniref:aldo/keto reductase n=1 Tax=unclassified Corynebacterium TaxID=2624378 RepID=UPI001185CF1F|nr:MULTISPECIES: aldo/keto reductase [unclassified Corynebacterium]MBP3088473.1 aldo/keto reductase [Corynebacterium sp. sy017]TSD91781.1 aldo/keto reductase [Corynebacterium sp. SY003]